MVIYRRKGVRCRSFDGMASRRFTVFWLKNAAKPSFLQKNLENLENYLVFFIKMQYNSRIIVKLVKGNQFHKKNG